MSPFKIYSALVLASLFIIFPSEMALAKKKKTDLSRAVASVAKMEVLQKIELDKVFKQTVFVNLYDQELVKKKAKLTDLSQLKWHEIQLQWAECALLAPKVFNKHKELQGWVGVTWLRCLNKATQKDSKSAKKTLPAGTLEKALDTLGHHHELFLSGAWASELWQAWLGLKWPLLEQALEGKDGLHKTSAEKEIDHLLSSQPELSKDQKAEAYMWLGDLARAGNNLYQAQFYYSQSLAMKETKEVSEKLDPLLKQMNLNFAKEQKQVALNIIFEKSDVPGDLSAEEEKLDDRLRQAMSQKQSAEAQLVTLKELIGMMNQFPAGRAAKKWKDKPLEIYNSLGEGPLQSKALQELSEADTSKLIDWSQSLHRKQDYAGALVLAQKAYEKNPTSSGVVSALWVAGRASHFLGKYPEALGFYQKLISIGKGTDESSEALLRTGLIYFRKKDFVKSAQSFEKLLQWGKELGKDRYDLMSLYWLIRSLENTNKERAQKLTQALILRYPFTYYGLRLNAETNNGKWIWPEIKSEYKGPLSTDLYLVGEQKKVWARFMSLAVAGWVSEAFREFQEGPMIKDPTLKVYLAEKLSNYQQYYLAIRLINEAMDAAPSLRKSEYLRPGYPRAFEALYKKEADRYKVDIDLLRSLTRQESGFNMRAVSTSNAMGLMQMIPPTAQEVAKKLNLKIELPEDMFRPEINIPMGSYYIAQMIEQFHGNVPFALAAYNAGPHRLKAWLEGRPEVKALIEKPSTAVEDEIWFDELPWTETSLYVKAIQRNIMLYKALAQ